jgi:uncharacterized protein with HEPN domain
MPSDRIEAALRDILRYATLAQTFIAGADLNSFRRDDRTILAATRCLEIISEASRRLPEVTKARHPQIEWGRMAAAGNVYRHEYDDVEVEMIWDTLQKALPPLLAALKEELTRE